jgi:hypothetical protein
MTNKQILQPYPREPSSYLAQSSLFPKLQPPMELVDLHDAIRKALSRAKKNKKGEDAKSPDTPEELVKLCLKHLKERSDPIMGTSFYSRLNASELFEMDEIPHEMQRYRMKIGVFYQYLLIELMHKTSTRENPSIVRTFDGSREGDVITDVHTPGYDKGLRLYISVKKSIDTVGGQDIGGAIKRLEDIAKKDKNLSSPYLCVIAIATPSRGKILGFSESRQIRFNIDRFPYSVNCEIWQPGFIFPYITGLRATEIYNESSKIVEDFFPFYSLKFRKEASTILQKELIMLGIANQKGEIIRDNLFKYIANESD